jgi:hypothetical protein
MRQAVQPEAGQPAHSAATPPASPSAPAPVAEKPAPKATGFYAATRAGKKKVTASLSPAMRRDLKSLAAAKDMTTEALLLEAIADLLTKHGVSRAP